MEKQLAKRLTRTIQVGVVDTDRGPRPFTVDLSLAYKVATGLERTTGLDLIPKGVIYPVLSISGQGPDCGGQCQTELSDLLHSGRLKRVHLMVQAILNLWNDWHLNDLNAGCRHQQEAGWTGFDKVNEKCGDCGYAYGSAWLVRPLPGVVERQVESLILEEAL